MSQAITTIPTLKQLCASQILSSGSHSTFSGENQKFFEHDVLYRLWSDLKACPQGVLCLQNEMSKIERKYVNQNGQFPADVKISIFFKELTHLFCSTFNKAGFQFGNLTPFCSEYVQLQEIVKKWDDEALQLIWDEGISPQLIGPAPQITQPDLREWLADGANATQLMGIRRLHSVRCGIKALPFEIRYCPRLRSLYLANNEITYLRSDIFEGCAKLREIRLDNNQISDISNLSFRGCSQLYTLRICGNKISSLPETLYKDCPSLKWIELDDNPITGFSESFFNENPEGIVLIKNCPLFCVIDNGMFNNHILIEQLRPRNSAFSNYNCLSNFSCFVKLLSFGTDNSAKIKGAFEQLERRDQCLIIEMVNLISDNKLLDPQGAEQSIFDDMNLFCRAVRKGIYEKYRQMSPQEKNKVHIEIFNLGKLEMILDEEFYKHNDLFFDLLSDPESEMEGIEHLGSSYVFNNTLLLIDAMDRVES